MALARYNRDGSLDPTFDGDGKVTISPGTGNDIYAVALQPDGKIVVAGVIRDPGSIRYEDAGLARFNSDGSLDATFDSDGIVATDFCGPSSCFMSDYARDLAIQPDGKILVAGSRSFYGPSFTIHDSVLARYNSDGSLDPTFDGDGFVLGGEAYAHAIALQPDGRILVAGSEQGSGYQGFWLARYHSDGSPDPTFDGDGKARTDFGGGSMGVFAIALQPDGRIVAAGTSTSGPFTTRFALARYRSDGSLDPTFDGDGKVLTALGSGGDFAYDLALQSDGRIVVTGMSESGGNRDFALARYNSDGSLDPTFHGDGKLLTDLGGSTLGGNEAGYGVAIQPDGRILLAGSARGEFAVLRYTETLFADVPADYWSLVWIERLYRAGITGGCATSPLRYCPDDSVTRAQMAVFLLRGIHTSAYTPPPIGAGSGFGDVPADYWSGAWIKQLAAEGITSGCGGGNYCPEQPVTRAQMAVFLLRSKYGASYTPPAVGGTTGFGDVPPSYWAAAFVKQLAAEGITAGCGGGNYCPQQSVTRAQMAVFLVRTFSLP
jgi:uncharacterized delta-60 repeat protein